MINYETISNDNEDSEFKTIKSTHLIQVGAPLPSKSLSKNGDSREYKINRLSDKNKKIGNIYSNGLLPPMSTLEDRIPILEHATLMNGKAKAHQSIKNKMKKADSLKERASHQQSQEFINSFRVLAGNTGNRL